MVDYVIGEAVKSLAGHDKGTVYIIVGNEGTKLFLCDGRLKKLAAPKKKSVKHVQLIHIGSDKLSKITDEEIKRFLKQFGGQDV